MRNLLLSLFAIFFMASTFAQSPQKLSYQAVVRNNSNALVTNTQVGMRISILQGSFTGTAVYVETQIPTTNANGLATVQIGGGTVVSGTFSAIDWSAGTYFIKTETDPAGGTTYTITGTSQLLTVPYALYADKAGSTSYTSLTNKPANIDDDKTDDVLLIGNQTIAGNKTFTGTTTVATPVNTTDAATKAYVDALKATIAALQTRETANLIANGYTDPRDGNHYKVVQIGTQVWLAQNLRYLPSVVGSSTGSATNPYYYVYGYNGTNVTAAKATANYTTYGVLYNWPAANIACPPGWHLPTDAEWTQLTDYLGGMDVAGGYLKEAGTTHWLSPNADATNSSGFTALPGGCRDGSAFNDLGNFGYCWSASAIDATYAWGRFMCSVNSYVYRSNDYKYFGLPVRCIRDN